MIITISHNYNDTHRFYIHLQMLNIYESWKGVLKVGPYSWKPMVEAAMLIMLPDSAIRGVSVLPMNELVYDHFYSSLIFGNCSALSFIESIPVG